ncbi:MFS multidrug transporter-like protein [Xylona heveae TC161]|uniref:MFS multidrug transporter-like protein n=1 Tax=Xylona heveae (strain CBS 132557 / TC161) TaxID=1328760 RepID=A0A165AH07_XYLHT|nr:MFS multidrug transporter-like protein [Xylona heveae TC161]KZF20456.1 MFS multidrug transporter-like protein [Xylona heveae TC161]
MTDLGRSRTASFHSRSSRTGSPQLHQTLSGRHMDDNTVYHDRVNHATHQDQHNTNQDSTEVEKDSNAHDDGEETSLPSDSSDDETVDEVRDGIRDERDVEAGPKSLEKKATSKSDKDRDPNLVTWDGPNDPSNPKNWTIKKKWAATFVVSSFTFITPLSSSMVAPSLPSIAKDFGITNEVESQLVLSIFVLALAVGPLFMGPLSEIYGRVPVLQLSNLFYLIWNLVCGFAQNKGEMIAFRFLSGLGGSAPLAIGGGILSDCWHPEQRGKSISIYSLMPLLGPALGPLIGGFITEKTTWRWSFWAVSIADAFIQCAGLIFLKETYAPKLLKLKADRLKKETGNQAFHTEYDVPGRTIGSLLRTSLVRPFRLLGTQPIIQALAVYQAYLYGIMYLVLSTFPTLWENRYHESVGNGGLNYIAIGLGFFTGTQVCAPLNDRIYRRLRQRNNGVGRPEFRVPLMFVGAAFMPIGLFWYGWSAQARTHWIVPDIGIFVFSAGIIVGFQCTQTYVVDSYTRFAASAVGATTVLRCIAGFGFPLFAPYMYAALDYGWGNSLLAFIALGLGVPAPFMLWKYGASLRAKSTFAAGGG